MFKKSVTLLVLAALVLALSSAVSPAKAAVTELKISWAQWAPADYLQTLVKDYEAKTGIKVTVLQEPWGTFGDKTSAGWAAKDTSYELIIGDSQWLGQGATQGHYVDLTDFMKSNGIDKTVTPGTLKYYGEYPAGSSKYWGYPTEGDANGFAYRKDLFDNKDEQAAFKAKYNRDLAVPTTWAELMDIAKFFTRKDKGLYGAAIYTQKDYDAITMGFENVFWGFGADWYDANYKADGVMNTDAAVKSLEFYKQLYDCCSPPGLTNAFFQEVNDAFTSGQAVMAMNYFAFFPALANKSTNKFADGTSYFVMPKGPTGAQFAALGGQGMSVNAYLPKDRMDAAFAFLKWFAQEDVQAKWADLGGYTCNINVLKSDKFNKIAPFNAAFAQTMNMVKDFTNIPEYGQMLPVIQAALSNYVVGGKGTAKEALDGVAKEWTQILKDGGYLK